MPPLMLRSSTFWMLFLSLGSSVSLAQTPEICPDATFGTMTDKGFDTEAPDGSDAKVIIDSDAATIDSDGDAALKGNVRVRQGSRQIRADEVRYNAADQAFELKGEIEYTDPLVSVRGTSGSYSAVEGANFRSAEFELRERSARGAAEVMRLTPQGVIELEDVSFTTCPVTNPAWRLHANDITLNTNTRLGTGRSTSVEFMGVPILYMPWMSFPLGTQRKSGFLFPSIGHSTRSGVELSVPYYWNIAPNADLTFEPVYYGRRGIDLAGELRYLTRRQRGTLDVNYLPHDDVTKDTRSRFHFQHVAELPYDFRFTIDATKVSDTEYFEDFAQGPQGTSVAFVERLARISFRNQNWRFSGEFQKFQTIDRELAEIDQPYARLPRIVASADFGWGPGERLRYGFDSELVNFDRDVGVTGWRLDVMPTAQLDFSGPGYFIRPGVAWRHTRYELDDETEGTDSAPSRTLPIASLDAGLIFERETGSHGNRRHTLEPRLLYLYVPFRDQNELPIFDTGLPDLNLVQLFRTNRYVGADRVSDANQVSVGVTTRLFDADDGTQFLAATLGQTYYFEAPQVQLHGEPPRNSERSDVVAQLALTAYKNWNADFGLQWTPSESRSQRAQVLLQYQPGDEQVVNFGYRFQRDRLEQAEVSSAWPIGRRWSLFGRYVHSLRDDTSLERFAGVEYRDCCWRVRLLGRRFVSSRTGEQDTGYYLQLELTGLASVGSAADAFLAGAIRGYTRDATRP
jgi:LPS-assembly protein